MSDEKKRGPHLVRIVARMIQGLSIAVVRHLPDRGLIPISGKNGSGKSSLLAVVNGALGGRTRVHERVVNDEAPDGKGYMMVELEGGWEIRRHHTPANPKGSLYVTGPDGGKHGQGKLDELTFGVDPDVQSFFGLPLKRKYEILMSIGKDPDLPGKLEAVKAERERLYAERTPHISTQRKSRAVERPEGERPEPIDTTAEMDRLTELQAQAIELENLWKQRDQHVTNREELLKALERAGSAVTEKIMAVNAAHAALERAQEELEAAREGHREIGQEIEAEDAQIEASTISAEAFPDPTEEMEKVRARIRTAQAVQEALEPWKAYDRAQQTLSDAEAEIARLEAEMAKLEERRKAMIASAEIPVPHLTFSPEGEPLYKGRPLELASGSERTRMALDVADAKGLGFTLIDEGDVLDDDTLAAIAEEAEASDLQVFICGTGRALDPGIHVEDGVAWAEGDPKPDPDQEEVPDDED